jgi:hypothetical protein
MFTDLDLDIRPSFPTMGSPFKITLFLLLASPGAGSSPMVGMESLLDEDADTAETACAASTKLVSLSSPSASARASTTLSASLRARGSSGEGGYLMYLLNHDVSNSFPFECRTMNP